MRKGPTAQDPEKTQCRVIYWVTCYMHILLFDWLLSEGYLDVTNESESKK